jgi:filamentous hemagglutinin
VVTLALPDICDLPTLTETVTLGQAEGAIDGIGNLDTGGARQTGNLIEQMTTLTGASITNIDEHGIDQGNLEVTTQHLVVKDINDIDTYDASTAGIAVGSNDGAPSLNSVEYTNNTKDKEQITRATIGSGTLNTQTTTGTLNRETGNIQEITKEKSSNTELYVSNRTLDLVSDPTGEIEKLGQKLDDVGLAAHVEILENLPSASKAEDGEGDLIDNTIGAVLDTLGDATLGAIPSADKDGGYVVQIATQLFGDNRTGLVVKDRETLIKAGVKEVDIEEVILVKTEDGVKPLSEVKNPEGLVVITVYRTNPNKTVVIGDPNDLSGNPDLEGYKIRLSEEDIKNSGIDHLFTNGMFNSHDTAVYNQQTQQGGADAVLNYNQMHGVVGDLLESAQDAIAVNSGISAIGTGGAGQTGDLIVQISDKNIRNGDLTVSAHSQGTLMTQAGMTQQQEGLEALVQGNQNAEFLVQYSGTPVNHNLGEELVIDIYGGKEGIEVHLGDNAGIDSVFRSNVTPQDFVGSGLGYQGSGINSSENVGANMWESLLSTPRLFGYGDPSPHSYYPCVIGCGDENYTPDIEHYYTPDHLDDKGKPQSPIKNYYQENFEVQRDDGTSEMTIDTELLPNREHSNSNTGSVNMNSL